MNSTGPIESWTINPMEVGPIYPFVGSEWLLVIACAAFCLAFLVWKMMAENKAHEAEAKQLREKVKKGSGTFSAQHPSGRSG